MGRDHKLVRLLCLSIWPPGTAPALRFRCEAYFPLLESRGFSIEQKSFFSVDEYESVKFARSVRTLKPILQGFLRTFSQINSYRQYDVIWLLREAAPVGPPLIEQFLIKRLGRPLVFDFDDAIWLSHNESYFARLLRFRSKTARIIKQASAVIAGNNFLGTYGRALNPNTSVVPTCVDLNRRYNRMHEHRPNTVPVVGWTGSHSTVSYLEPLDAILKEGQRRREYDVSVISDRPPRFSFGEYTFHPWSTSTEINDLLKIDIGLMPLKDSAWELGKCGFKLIQYMALGIPPIASAVGVNNEIIRHGVDGFLCRTEADWIKALRALSSDPALRAEMGRNGRKLVADRFSTDSQVDRLARIFRSVGAGSVTASDINISR